LINEYQFVLANFWKVSLSIVNSSSHAWRRIRSKQNWDDWKVRIQHNWKFLFIKRCCNLKLAIN